MNTRTRALLVCLAAAAGGCEFQHGPTAVDVEPSVVVHAVLSTGADQAGVLLTRVGPETEESIGQIYPFGPGIEPLSGAEVHIVAGGETLRLVEAAEGLQPCFASYAPNGNQQPTAGKGCYAARVPGGIRAGVEYHLQIRLADGRTVEGKAVPPALPELSEPEVNRPIPIAQATPDRSPSVVRVRVRPGSAASGLGVSLQPVTVFKGGAPMQNVHCSIGTPTLPPAPADTANIVIYGLGCYQHDATTSRQVMPDSIHARLYVSAYDAALVLYQSAIREEQSTAAAMTHGISGAVGLFGSEATIQRMITLFPGS